MPRFTADVALYRTLTTQWPWVPSIGQHLQPFTGNGEDSEWVKISRVGWKPPNKQPNIDRIIAKNKLYKNQGILYRV